MKIHAPIYLQIYEREGTQWFFHGGKTFYNPRGIKTDFESILAMHNLTKIKVLVSMFRINGGKAGYYLADLRHKRYYYCGRALSDVKSKLRELGIGRDEPIY